jgi:hypothetical protein
MKLQEHIEENKIKLLIIDNIQSLCLQYTKADESVDFIERSNFLLKHSKFLKKLAF